jgi:hypothetical protein
MTDFLVGLSFASFSLAWRCYASLVFVLGLGVMGWVVIVMVGCSWLCFGGFMGIYCCFLWWVVPTVRWVKLLHCDF